MPFYVVNQDITSLKTDAIVNSANKYPIIAEGVEETIYSKAGIQLLDERKQIGIIEEGSAKISKGYNLSARYVIHAVAPVYNQEDTFTEQLKQTYISAIDEAITTDLESIAFPLLASGNNGCPRDKAIEIAIDTLTIFSKKYDIDIYLVLYKPYMSKSLQKLSNQLSRYIKADNIRKREDIFEIHSYQERSILSVEDFENFSSIKEVTFQQKLFNIIDSENLNEVEVYKNANITRKLFSKIRSDQKYLPSKRTCIALCISLKLNVEESNELLECAGYTLSRGIEFDIMILFFIEQKIYDIDQINLMLFEYHQPLLGSK